jgi:hypothetical protein
MTQCGRAELRELGPIAFEPKVSEAGLNCRLAAK